MKWVESEAIARERARLQNRMVNGVSQKASKAALAVVLFGLIPMVGVPLISLVEHRKVMWGQTFLLAALCSVTCVIATAINNWRRPERGGIVLGSKSLTLRYKRFKKTAEYDHFIGFSIFDIHNLSNGKLLVFCEQEGRHLSIGIPSEVSLEELRSFLSGKLGELSNSEVPEPRNSYERKA